MNNDKLLKIFGTDELVKVFIEMDSQLQNTIMIRAYKMSAKIIIDEAKGNLGGSYKGIQSSLSYKYDYAKQQMAVGTMKRRGGQLAYIAESGTKERSYKTDFRKDSNETLHKTGKITATHFFSRAINTTEKNTTETIYNEIKKRFDIIVSKNNRVKQ